MALIKREYIDEETLITAQNLNDIQDAILALEDGLFIVEDDKSGEVIKITNASRRGFRSLSIYGKTTQDGTPTPDTPVELVNIGNNGSITVEVTGENDSKSMTISTPNGLPGIPVTSGGNYIDANGQRWICDEIDLARGVYVQRCNTYAVTGSEQPFRSSDGWQGDGMFSAFLVTFKAAHNIAIDDAFKVNYCLSNYCVPNGWEWANGDRLNNVCVRSNNIHISLDNEATGIISGDTDETKISKFKAYLASQYAAGTPMIIQYVLATPIETPLSDEEIAAYAALHTYKDNTTVSNDADAYMALEYAVDAKKYIDSLKTSSESGRIVNISLPAAKWTGTGSLYSQVVTIAGITETSQVNLTPTISQMSVFYEKDITFITENDDGVVTVYVIGQKPTNDYTIPANIVEVRV